MGTESLSWSFTNAITAEYVGIMVKTSLTGMVQKWVADSELPARIMMMKIGSVNIGCPYAPTESRYSATDESKFYTQLSTVYRMLTKDYQLSFLVTLMHE